MLELRGTRVVHHPGTAAEVVALDSADLTVPDGQFVTVVGSNGAGKSTLIDVICGSVPLVTGEVLIDGQRLTNVPDYRRARCVARVFDNPVAGTAAELTIEENMALAFSRGARRRLRFAVHESRRRLMREKLATVGLGLERRLKEPVMQLSAGQRQSLTMLMASIRSPRILLCDEHLAALDPRTARAVLGLTVDIARSMGSSTIMVTHNMEHAIAVGDRLLVMSGGRIVADFSENEKQELTSVKLVERIVGVGDAVSDRMLLRKDGAAEVP